jgi:tellurite resistance protein
MAMDELRAAIDSTIETAINEAKKDGIITEDEKALIESIRNDTELMYQAISAIIDKENVSDDELYDTINAQRTQLMTNVCTIAYEDGIITEDEKAIITSLIPEILGE